MMDTATTLIELLREEIDCLVTRVNRLVAIRDAADDLVALWNASGIVSPEQRESAIEDAQTRLALLLNADRIS